MFVILVDMRENSGQIVPIVDDTEAENLAQFSDLDDIKALRLSHILGMFPWWIVDMTTYSATPKVFVWDRNEENSPPV